VAIEASNGASDYGNKFGEPVILGFVRSFGMNLVRETGYWKEWMKPIMFSGGLGSVDAEFLDKCSPQKGELSIAVGCTWFLLYFLIKVQSLQSVSRCIPCARKRPWELGPTPKSR
jgi:hypothetical protein